MLCMNRGYKSLVIFFLLVNFKVLLNGILKNYVSRLFYVMKSELYLLDIF